MKKFLLLPTIMGVCFGIIAYFILKPIDNYAFLLAIAAALITFLLLFLFLIFETKRLDKKYSEFETKYPFHIFHKTNGNFQLENGIVKNGNIYFSDKGIVCVSLDGKPYTYDEILLQNILRIQTDGLHLQIRTNDSRVYVITMPDAKEVLDMLIEKGWCDGWL